MPDIFAHQIRPLHLDQMSLGQDSHLLEQLGDQTGYGCFSGTRIPLEYHMVHVGIGD
ncbi:hypothetical protein D3C71_1959630 [compost metagenome]